MPFEPTPSRGVVPSYATDAQSGGGGASTNENNDGLLPSVSPNPAPLPTAAPLPLPGADATADAASRWLPVLYSAGGVLLLGLLLASPQLARTALRRRRLCGARGDARRRCRPGPSCATSPWTTAWRRGPVRPRVISPTGCASRAPSGNRKAWTRTATGPSGSLTADFERRQYGRPPSGGDGAGVPGSAVKTAGGAAAAGSTGSPAAHRIEAVRSTLRAHAGPLVRFRAAWLPPSLMATWRRAATAPFRAGRRATHSAPGAASRVSGQ